MITAIPINTTSSQDLPVNGVLMYPPVKENMLITNPRDIPGFGAGGKTPVYHYHHGVNTLQWIAE